MITSFRRERRWLLRSPLVISSIITKVGCPWETTPRSLTCTNQDVATHVKDQAQYRHRSEPAGSDTQNCQRAVKLEYNTTTSRDKEQYQLMLAANANSLFWSFQVVYSWMLQWSLAEQVLVLVIPAFVTGKRSIVSQVGNVVRKGLHKW